MTPAGKRYGRPLDGRAEARAHAQPVSFAVEHFQYASAQLLLRLSLRTTLELSSPPPATLLLQHEAVEHSCQPLLSYTRRTPINDAGEWMWRGAFAVSPELAGDPRTQFALRFFDEVLCMLPTPDTCMGETAAPAEGAADGREGAAGRRRTLALLATCQLCVVVACASPGALADGSPSAASAAEPASEPPPSGTTSEPAEPAPAPPPVPAPAAAAETPTTKSPAPTTTSTTTTPSATTTTPTTPAEAPAGAPAPPGASEAPSVAVKSGQKASGGKTQPSAAPAPAAKKASAKKKPRAGKASAAGPNEVALAPGQIAAEAQALAAELASSQVSDAALSFYRIPLFLLPIYQAAAAQYGVPWQILAAINEVETDYGNDLSVSSAGAVGWMQFMPATWLQYGVDALNAGYADPYNPVDAIFAAARYLRAAGAQNDLRVAILAYNHSQDYLSSVLLRAKLISAYPQGVINTLTALTDGRLPVRGQNVSWSPLSSPAHTASKPASQASDVMSAPGATVVAVQDGRIAELGDSRALGRYVVLRDIYGDLFTYSGLGSIAPTYRAPKAPLRAAGPGSRTVGPIGPAAKLGLFARAKHAASATRAHARRAAGPMPLRRGALVQAGTVLGHVRTPRGARDGHMRFAIRPTGDASTVDPGPILRSWAQLYAALHLQGAPAETHLIGLSQQAVARSRHSALKRARRAESMAAAPTVARSTATGPDAASALLLSDELSSAQWNRLIARAGALAVPAIPLTRSSAAVRDPAAP